MAPGNYMSHVKMALDDVRMIHRLVEACGASGRGVARRAKDLPSMVASAGLVPALTFYMSKASEEVYKAILRYLDGGDAGALCKGLSGKLVEELGEKEGAGYSTLLALAARFLSKNGLLGSVGGYPELAGELSRLAGDPARVAAAEGLLLEYLIEVKKLAEAFFRE